jgi:nicotinamidase-related amidase
MSAEHVIDPRRTGLLLMDFQNDIVAKGGSLAPSDDEAFGRIAAAIASANVAAQAARTAGVAVIHVAVGRQDGEPAPNPHMPIQQFIAKANALVIGTEGYALHPDLQPAEGEYVVIKGGISAFAGTALAPMLQGRGIDTVVLCGFATHMVVVGTARDAADRGYRAIVLEDCCASGGLDRHQAALANIAMIGAISDSKTFAAALKAAG